MAQLRVKNTEFHDTTLTHAENIILALDSEGSAPVRHIISPCPTPLHTKTSFLNILFLNNSPTYQTSLFQGLFTKIMYGLLTSC